MHPTDTERLQVLFQDLFSSKPEAIVSAPGRIEICGNHTDHQNGCAVTGTIDLDICGAAGRRDDLNVRLVSREYGEVICDLSSLDPDPSEFGTSVSIIRGTASRITSLGYELKGFDAYIESSIPMGSGLSSSAAFEILITGIFSHFYCNDRITNKEAAHLSYEVENTFFGKPSGKLDQIACSYGGICAIDFRNVETPSVTSVSFDAASHGYSVVIVNVNADHANLTGEYASIRKEMNEISGFFGKDVLREVDEDSFYKAIPELRKRFSDRHVIRAHHFFEENRRAMDIRKCFEENDMDGILKIVYESGRSSIQNLQNIYPSFSPSSQAITVALAISERLLEHGRYGVSRVHGGGFGGTILSFVSHDRIEEYLKGMKDVFGEDNVIKLNIRPYGFAARDL